MDVQRLRALRGPNLWSRHTAIETVVVCTPAEHDIQQLDGFEQRLRALFPKVGALRPASNARMPISLAHVIEQAALALQAQAGCPVTFSHTHKTNTPGHFQVVVEYSEEDVGRLAMEEAEKLVRAALEGRTDFETAWDADAVVKQLREIDEDVRLGPSTGSIVNAAVARGVPYRRLTQGSLVQFGWGVKQRRIWAAEVDATSAVSESIAQDKDLSKRLLQSAGVPVPFGRPVDDVEDGWRAATEEIGLPVVVKPLDGNQGKGVTVNVVSRDHFELAYKAAEDIGTVLVEKYLPGSDFRLLVVGNQLVAAARRDPPQVSGDGVSTVRQLVDEVNKDPKRGDGHATSLTKMRLDDIAIERLRQQGLTIESVPAKGQRVILRNNANLSTGGSATDVTDDVHPEVAQRAIAAAQIVGLHVCGVDVVAETVMRPLEEVNGGIVEVNAAPGLRMHLSPSFGKGRNVGKAVIQSIYGPDKNADGRIPVVSVTGVNGKTTVTRLIAHLFATAGLKTGMTNTDGVYVDGRQIDSGDCSGPKSARNVLLHPDVEAAVLECARGGILREGLGFDRCQVAVVTNIGTGDHLGLNYLDTVEDIKRVKSVIVQNVAPSGYAVLNAADPLVASMAEQCPGGVIYFCMDRHLPLMATHRAQGKRCVFIDDGHIVAIEGNARDSIPLRDVPMTRGGLLGFQVENAMAAVAAAWAVGLPTDVIRRGLASFNADSDNAPGRFNVMDFKGATVVADYGHNPDAIRALVRSIDALPASRRCVVISGAGDRRDQDIVEQTQILGGHFDQVVLYQDACQRGREDGEVVGLLRKGLEGATRTKQIDEIRGEFVAIDHAFSTLKEGELCLVLVDQVEEALAHLRKRCSE